jgi:hypothetical protein
MSADNGIYILRTLKKDCPEGSLDPYEYRVAHLQAIENVDWDETTGGYTEDPDVRIKNAREMWARCNVVSKKEVDQKADELERKYGWTEYGIAYITIERVF